MNRRFRTFRRRVVAAAGAAAMAAAANAASIHVAFHTSNSTVAAMAPAALPTNQGTVANTATAAWNNILCPTAFGQAAAGTNLLLLLEDGTPSGALLSYSSGYCGLAGNGWNNSARNKDYVMMEGWFGYRATEFLAVSNLPPSLATGGYRVVVYGDCNDASRTMNYTLRGVTRTIQDNGVFAGNLAPFTVEFGGLTGSAFTVTGNPATNDKRSAVNGLQILPDVPRVLDFRASRRRVAPGGAAVLRWTVAGPTASLTITPGPGDVTALTTNGSGAVAVTPATSTVYTLAVTGAGTTATATESVVVGPPVPNLLLFLVDDMGWEDTSLPFCYTNGVPRVTAQNLHFRTPHMETLAARGMMFTAAYAAPVCSPTRVSLMTGKNTARHQVTFWLNDTVAGPDPGTADLCPPPWRTTGLASNEVTLPQLLRGQGYRTLFTGKSHLGITGSYAETPDRIGFDVNVGGGVWGSPGSYYGTNNFVNAPPLTNYYGSNIFLTAALTLEMNKLVGQAVTDGAPFFAYLPHYAVHTPKQTDPRFASNYPGASGAWLSYSTMIEGMDASLGGVLSNLQALGAAENTLVVFLTDNGGDTTNVPLRNKKGTLYEGGVRVPMIWAWAATNAANPFQQALPIAPGSRVTDSVLAWDVFSTLLGAAGITHTQNVDGVDLRGYLRGEPGFRRPQQFAIHYPHRRNNGAYSQDPGTLYRDGDWKIIHVYQGGTYQLFNLAADLSETNDLAAAEPARLMTMARAMARELQRLGAQFPLRKIGGVCTNIPVTPVMPNLPALDVDGDGIPDLAEDVNTNGLVEAFETDPDRADTDGDGTSDGAEVRAGTDPLDPASNFTAALAATNGLPSLLRWPGRTGALYRVDASPAPESNLWDLVTDDIPGTPGVTTHPLPPAEQAFPRRVYRVLLK